MIKQRNIGVAILLSIVTFGIYGIYWFIKLTDETNQLARTKTAGGGMAFVYTLITCGIYGIYWYYKLGQKVNEISGGTGSEVVYLILCLVGLGIVAYALAQSEVNKRAIP